MRFRHCISSCIFLECLVVLLSQVKIVRFVAAVPKSASGKILRRVLKVAYMDELAAAAAAAAAEAASKQ